MRHAVELGTELRITIADENLGASFEGRHLATLLRSPLLVRGSRHADVDGALERPSNKAAAAASWMFAESKVKMSRDREMAMASHRGYAGLMRRMLALTRLVLAPALVGACAIPGTWTGETVDGITLYTDDGTTACAGVLPRLVHLQERIAAELDVESGSVEYYFTENTEKVAQLCKRSVPGCAFPIEGRVLYSGPDIVSSHELTHVLANRGLDPVPLTSEGLAVYFSDDRVTSFRLNILPALNDPLMHDTAGAFVSYLIQMYGIDEVFAFHKETRRGMSEDEFVRSFEDRFSITLSDLEDAVDTDPAPLTPPFAACDAPLLEQTADGFARRIDCDDDALGVRGRAYTHNVVQVDAGTYRMRLRAADRVVLQGCVSGVEETWFDDVTYFFTPIESAYSMKIWAPEGASEADVNLAFQPADLLTTCSPEASVPAEEIALPGGFAFSVVGPLAIPFQVSSPALLEMQTTTSVRICTDACQCSPAPSEPMELEPARRYWLDLPEGPRDGYLSVDAR